MTYTAAVGIGRHCQADPSMPANLVREKAVIRDLFTDRQPIGAEVQTGTRGRSRGWGSRRCDIYLVDGSGYELTEHRSEQQLGIEEGRRP